jgi:hypothetical protein
MQTPFRLEPRMPAHAYTTYELIRPRSTHYRPATCAEVSCAAYANGWRTTLDVSTPMGARQANYIRLQSGRRFTVREFPPSGAVEFTFPAGQQCFAAHRLPLEREPLYVVRGGDHRGNPRQERRVHTRGDLWVEDMQGQFDSLKTEISKG